METANPWDCDCWRLVRPLEPAAALPDHVCDATYLANVRAWVEETSDDALKWLNPMLDHAMQTKPAAVPAMFSGRLDKTSGLSRRMRTVVELQRLKDLIKSTWPLPHVPLPLGLAIRQWAEEGPSETLSRQLVDYPYWQAEVQIHETEVARLARKPNWDPQAWIEGRLPPDRVDGGSNAMVEHRLSRELMRHGLPGSPSTIRHLRARAAGLTEPLPARGLLVTTLVFVFIGEQRGDPFILDDSPSFSISGPSAWSPGPLLERAHAIALRHRDWVKGWAPHSLTETSFVRRVQAGSFADHRTIKTVWPSDRFDYVAEALRDRDRLPAVPQGQDPATFIRHYLNKVYNRVSARRRQAKMPTTPPANWRKEPERQLRPLIRP